MRTVFLHGTAVVMMMVMWDSGHSEPGSLTRTEREEELVTLHLTHLLISQLLWTFERGVQQPVPNCRCVLLPTGKRYKVIEHLNSLTSEGFLLVSIPVGCFPFKNGRNLLSGDLKKKPNIKQSLRLFIWCNREYLQMFLPPLNVEDMYQVWIDSNLERPERVILHRDAFDRAFPFILRRSGKKLTSFHFQIMQIVV